MSIKVRIIRNCLIKISLFIIFIITGCVFSYSQRSNGNNDLYRILLNAINGYYDNYINKNPINCQSTRISIKGLPLGFKYDSLHTSNLYLDYDVDSYPASFRRKLKKGLSVISSHYKINDSTLEIVVYREYLDLSQKKLTYRVQDSCSFFYILQEEEWVPTGNRSNLQDTLNDLLVFCINDLDSCESAHNSFNDYPESYFNDQHFQKGFSFNRFRNKSILYTQRKIKTIIKHKIIGVWDLQLTLKGSSLIIIFRPTLVILKRKRFHCIVNSEDRYVYVFRYSSSLKKWLLVRCDSPGRHFNTLY